MGVDHCGHFRKKAIPGWVKKAVVQREGAIPGATTTAHCHYCGCAGEIWWPLTYTGKVGAHVGLINLEFDHVFPEFHGGATSPDNMVIACRPCNRAKRDKVLA
jgi:5-methylcytosine-specific restriction endonuclease McrA